MKQSSRGLAIAALALLPFALPTTSASADGLPGDGLDTTRVGVSSLGGDVRYLALEVPQGTLVERISQAGGKLLGSTFIRGTYTVPGVAYDGSTSGLSGDGRTLVLIRPRATFPRSSTTLVVLAARQLRMERRVTLSGDFSFDAISPNGRRLYLIEYVSRTDSTRYRVRAFDLRQHRLLAEPIVDPNEQPGSMYGWPMARAMSPDGRWAYTLYDGREYPFIHALDTRDGTAVCIDLDSIAGTVPTYRMRLDVAPGGETIDVLGRGEPIATVDTTTFDVSGVSATAAESSSDGGDTPWAPLAVGAAALGLTLLLLRHRRNVARPGPLPGHPPYIGRALGGDSPRAGRNGAAGHAREHADLGAEGNGAGGGSPAREPERTRA
jgi:hypothetical protein